MWLCVLGSPPPPVSLPCRLCDLTTRSSLPAPISKRRNPIRPAGFGSLGLLRQAVSLDPRWSARKTTWAINRHGLSSVESLCARLLGLWSFWFNRHMSDVNFKMAERKICFEMGERKQSPFPVCLCSLTSFSLRVGFNSVFISSGYALSWHTNSMCERCGSWESCSAISLLKINSGILTRAV